MSNKNKIIGIIPARLESKRFPKKLLADVHGKPLIQLTYENAQKCAALEELYVATGDQEIIDCVKGFGGHVIVTDVDCFSGSDRLVQAVHREEHKADIVVNIQGDEPSIEPEVIQAVVDKLKDDEEAVMSTALVKITDESEVNDPHVVKCVIDEKGHALYFSRMGIPGGERAVRYKHLGIYAYRMDFLMHYGELEPTPLQKAEDLEQLKVLEHGFVIKTAIVKSNSIGVDTPQDLERLCNQNTSSSQAGSARH